MTNATKSSEDVAYEIAKQRVLEGKNLSTAESELVSKRSREAARRVAERYPEAKPIATRRFSKDEPQRKPYMGLFGGIFLPPIF